MWMELIDIGVNLTHESFHHDLPDVLHHAARVGVRRMVVTGTSVQATQEALALHRQHPDRLFATAGLHPHHAADFNPAVRDSLRALAREPGVVAIGECGLDYFRDLSPRDAQRTAFAAQLELAVETGLPVFLHQRDAHADFAAVLRDYLPRLAAGVAHCFTGQPDELDDCLTMGLHVGITGWICDERRGRHLLPLMPRIPADRLMIETDAPYLLPRSLKPAPSTRRNEPAFLPEVARAVAAARGESIEALAISTTRTAVSFFRLPGNPAGTQE
jgi:TatD DNase family protein